jgi:hypothetical protein
MTVGSIMGCSTATTVGIIADGYGHIGQSALRRAIQQREHFERAETTRGVVTNFAPSQTTPNGGIQ